MTRILVVGAGVAGEALAARLRHHAIDVTIVERAPGPRPGGQGIDIRGAAREVIDRMGLTRQVRAAHTGVRGIRQVDAAGRVRVEMPADAVGHSGGIVADLEILRSDLVRILAAAAGHDVASGGVERVFGDTVTSLAERSDGVDVTFARSAPRRFDAVVGADGVFSAVRRLMFPEARLIDSGYHRAVFTMSGGPDLDGWELMYSMPAGNGTTGGRNVLLYPTRDSARAMVHFACPPMEYDRHDVEEQKRIVDRVLAGESWHVPQVRAALHDAPDFYFDRHGRVETPWRRGRVVLLGDACAAGSVGMGTTIALVGAYVMAGELARRPGDPRSAFAAYEERVRPYAHANSAPLPGGTKAFLPATRRAIRTGQTVTRWLLRTPLAGPMMGGIDKRTGAIELPEYDGTVGAAPVR
ncbi:FAD-dependent monooxygenase [Myceligenerans indicum]|uniref:NAD(P)-binding protein n=1 Tax=Myceligenerans indicum TaxID=2593663 RepID=A0ABS1LK95_9MICO|nr:FAD-dependent monooxygenase [Myceligenerans indicum]MBL0885992.1 NAD(P)-binding protein [Myceligenerans indicum]